MSGDQKSNGTGDIIKLCGLWKNKTKDGKTYYSGGLTYLTNLILFNNEYKRGENDPDLILYIAKKEQKPKSQEQEVDDDEIPF